MKKISYLDGLRGLAAFVVVIHHFLLAFYPATYNADMGEIHTRNAYEVIMAKSPLNLLINGNFAVCIFFILSGYVLTQKYFKTKDIEVIVSSACRRYFRLFIPVAASIFIVFMLMKLHLFFNIDASEISKSSWWLGTFWNFQTSIKDMIHSAVIGTFFNHDNKYNTALWTMSYELYGSFLVFAISGVIGKLKWRYFGYLILCALFVKTYYLAFILGLILADLKNSHDDYLTIINNNIINVSLLILGLFLGSYPTGVNVDGTIYSLLKIEFTSSAVFMHIIGSLLVMISLLNYKKFQEILSRRLFIFLGKISFTMYLTHAIILGSISSFVFIEFVNRLSYSAAVLSAFLIYLVVVLIIAHIMNKYVDNTGIRISSYIYNKLMKKYFDPILSLIKMKAKRNSC